MRALDARYDDEDLQLIGVHTPEFERERDIERVRAAAIELGIGFPVVLDNDWTIWRAFDNHYWPALYLIDKAGRIRGHHRGELHEGTPAWETWLAEIEALRAEG